MKFRSILSILLVFAAPCVQAGSVEHVIVISFDGLRPDAITTLGRKGTPNFHELMKKGASTLNARTDPDRTITMPNHTCMITGRGVIGPAGHNYTDNRSTSKSIHQNKGSRVDSMFDVARANGKTTGFFASKLKFQVFLNSYAVDVHSVTDSNDALTLQRLLAQMKSRLPSLTFVHFAGLDFTGHRLGWNSKAYFEEVRRQDKYLGQLIDAVRSNVSLSSTVVLITADHGGFDFDHDDISRLEDYRVPFIIWGKGVATGGDLYTINIGTRKNPGDRQVSYDEPQQPVRNGDAANAALHLLGLPPVPGSFIGDKNPLKVSPND